MNDGDRREESAATVVEFLEEGVSELSLPVTRADVEKLANLVMILESWAQRINLTGHRDPIQMAGHLVLDAASMADCLSTELSAFDRFADLGTGAGFPGLPIAILNPTLDSFLVDSRKKRNHFQREVRRRLELSNVHPVLGRSDEIEPELCDLVIAQAMTQPTQALGLMREWSRPGGILVLPASEDTTAPTPPPGIEAIERRTYEVPQTGVRRQLWLFRSQ